LSLHGFFIKVTISNITVFYQPSSRDFRKTIPLLEEWDFNPSVGLLANSEALSNAEEEKASMRN
jgi:hypothetical protein